MTSAIFLFLLFIMLIVLYKSGMAIQNNEMILSWGGISAIIIYTLNEGLRFGRGIDYFIYYNDYADIVAGRESRFEFVFVQLCKCFAALDFPFQVLILFMSFMFILSLLSFMQNFRFILPLALPFFVFFSRPDVENMVRWYLAFSFFLFGLADLIKKEKLSIYYWAFSLLACSIHYAILPIPILFYIIYRFKFIFLKPFFSLPAFFAVYFFFETDFMLQFVDIVNILLNVSGERFAEYENKAEYWLTGGYAGEEVSGKIGFLEMLFISVLVILGYRASKYWGRPLVFSYNLFIVGVLLLPVARKIELIVRYDAIFYFFRAIVMAAVLYFYYIQKKSQIAPFISMFCLLILLYFPFSSFKAMIHDNPKKYLYVWNKEGMTPEKMYQMWINDIHDSTKSSKN